MASGSIRVYGRDLRQMPMEVVMRTWLSPARRARMRRSLLSAAVVVGSGLALAVPTVTATASSAQAALAPVVGCGFHFGTITDQGAAGTEFLSVALRPANPAE